MRCPTAGAHHELAKACGLVDHSVAVERREPFVLMGVSVQHDVDAFVVQE